MTIDQFGSLDALTAAAATMTPFCVECVDGGVRLSWGDDPLDFIVQANAQTVDLINKLSDALS